MNDWHSVSLEELHMQVAEFTKKKTLESVACPPVVTNELEDELFLKTSPSNSLKLKQISPKWNEKLPMRENTRSIS